MVGGAKFFVDSNIVISYWNFCLVDSIYTVRKYYTYNSSRVKGTHCRLT
jgi:hypothetical protein